MIYHLVELICREQHPQINHDLHSLRGQSGRLEASRLVGSTRIGRTDGDLTEFVRSPIVGLALHGQPYLVMNGDQSADSALVYLNGA